MTFWQRFLARPPLRAWAIGLAPALALLLLVRVASDDSGIRFAGAFGASIVMQAVAAAVWPRLDGNG